jgi:hypothetical protein
MNMNTGTEATQLPEKEYINGFFFAVQAAGNGRYINGREGGKG